uniref:Ovule protein n=1 Tax=Meloidogyne incognita TaxID=6306 RepID=A0A914MD61_MELIC
MTIQVKIRVEIRLNTTKMTKIKHRVNVLIEIECQICIEKAYKPGLKQNYPLEHFKNAKQLSQTNSTFPTF